jgi:hypothetical protein
MNTVDARKTPVTLVIAVKPMGEAQEVLGPSYLDIFSI